MKFTSLTSENIETLINLDNVTTIQYDYSKGFLVIQFAKESEKLTFLHKTTSKKIFETIKELVNT